jgi:hypothetical protein
MDWLRINKNLPRHPKAKALARQLGEQVAWWRVAQVWAWCVEYAQEGRIVGEDAALNVEDAASWNGQPGAFVEACVRVGFLNRVEGGLEVHDWEEHNGKAIKQAEASIERKRQWRDEARTGGTNGHADATRGNQGRHEAAARTPRVDETRRDETVVDAPAALEPLESASRGAPIPWLVDEVDATLRGGAPLERRLWSWMSWRRMLVAPEHEPEPSVKRLKALSAGVAAHGVDLVRKAWLCWLVDPWAAQRDPPHALGPFLAADQLAQFVSRASRLEWRADPDHPDDWQLPEHVGPRA